MKFNIFFLLRGAGKTLEVPNKTNPVECANLAGLLDNLARNLPSGLGIETIGIRVVQVDSHAGKEES